MNAVPQSRVQPSTTTWTLAEEPALLAPALDRLQSFACAQIGRHAVLSLYDELALAPKPGLVSFVDAGSHRDMDARTFLRSLFALRRTFPSFARLGAEGAGFAALEREGLDAEVRMLRATAGINTHRGAIFTLGLLCAAAGRCLADRLPVVDSHLRGMLRATWGADLARRAAHATESHGANAARRLGLRSAGREAADAFPVLFEIVWPSLRDASVKGLAPERARLQALFAAMAALEDTNLAHRGGLQALRDVQGAARQFLDAGGAAADDAQDRAWALHRELVQRNLSPGGAADLLAAACWLQRVTSSATT
ncbi:MAG: triphosphoribosyl-dephospho-CoA synthase MdcB [Caldimonas sp.]